MKISTFVLMVLLSIPAHADDQSKWVYACGNIWSGVKLYAGQGDKKSLVGEILGGNDDHVDPLTGEQFRGVKVRMKSGKAEWKDRDAICERTDLWFVDRAEAKAKMLNWVVFAH